MKERVKSGPTYCSILTTQINEMFENIFSSELEETLSSVIEHKLFSRQSQILYAANNKMNLTFFFLYVKLEIFGKKEKMCQLFLFFPHFFERVLTFGCKSLGLCCVRPYPAPNCTVTFFIPDFF